MINTYGTSNPVEAIKIINLAVAVKKADVFTYNNMINAYGTRNPDKAKKIFDKAVEARQANTITYNRMIEVFSGYGNTTFLRMRCLPVV